VRIKCPECQSIRLRVIVTAPATNGDTVRRRNCLACGHRWYTVQSPEEVLSQYQVNWIRVGTQNKVKIIASPAA
jgi:transcriptional regulator NrdR family protein